MTSSYVTPSEVASALGITAPPQAVCDRASRQIDRALIAAVYDVDSNGVATDAKIAAAIKAATIEQIAGQRAAGDLTGLGTRTAGGFTLGRLSVQAAGAGDPAAPRQINGLWEQAWLILQQAGLTGEEPQAW